MALYLLQETGYRVALEDGTGFLILEESIVDSTPRRRRLAGLARRNRRRKR